MSHRLTKVYALTLSIFKSLFNENAQVYIEHSLSCWRDSLGSLFVPFFSSSFLQCMRRQQIAKKKLGDSKQSAIIWSTQKRILLRSLGAESTKKSNNPWFLFYSVWQLRDATKLLAAFLHKIVRRAHQTYHLDIKYPCFKSWRFQSTQYITLLNAPILAAMWEGYFKPFLTPVHNGIKNIYMWARGEVQLISTSTWLLFKAAFPIENFLQNLLFYFQLLWLHC